MRSGSTKVLTTNPNTNPEAIFLNLDLRQLELVLLSPWGPPDEVKFLKLALRLETQLGQWCPVRKLFVRTWVDTIQDYTFDLNLALAS